MSLVPYFFRLQTFWLFFGYFTLRGASFFLRDTLLLQSILVFLLVMMMAALYFKSKRLAWHLVLFELLLGGSGIMLELGTISIRTLFVYTFSFLWIVHHGARKGHAHKLKVPHTLFALIAALVGYACISAIIGLANGYGLAAVLPDIIPYTYAVLILPTYHLIHDADEMKQGFLLRAAMVFIFATALFSILNEFLFSSGLVQLHGEYYNWLRDVLAAKITLMDTGFWRIVFPEHLLVVPGIVIILSLLMRDELHHWLWRLAVGALMIILILNFSRTYMLALLVATPFLLLHHKFSEWIKEVLFAIVLFSVLFVSIHLVASGGSSIGVDLLVSRFGAIADPASEISTYSRTQLLSPIFSQIVEHPIFGSGLGASLDTVTPLGEVIKTNQYEWGWFETIAKMGVVGTLLLVSLIGFLISNTLRHIRDARSHQDLHVGMIAAVVSMLIMHLFAPIFSHVYGILLLVALTSLSSIPVLSHELVISKIYMLFHRHSPFH